MESNTTGQSELESYGNEGRYSTLHRSPELVLNYQMQFRVKPKIPFSGEVLSLCRRCCQCILSPTDRILISRDSINYLP